MKRKERSRRKTRRKTRNHGALSVPRTMLNALHTSKLQTYSAKASMLLSEMEIQAQRGEVLCLGFSS